ncbi:MAG: ThuA domain-containing protein [Planctomycetota bacterium]
MTAPLRPVRLLLVLLLLLMACPIGRSAAKDDGPLRVLFLGDQGHHQPKARSEQLIPVLKERGIAVTYTDRVEDLNPLCLTFFDGVILFANIDSISPQQEAALLEFIENGGGFVPIHCASYCFRNSEAFVELVGAQFMRHGAEVFTARITQPDHPALKGFEAFASFDETYVHTRHNQDRQVLMVRDEPDGSSEPYTWVRTHGKGRVFYTALGHDQRTWGQPEFADLIEAGLRWACQSAHALPDAGFELREANIPFYPKSDRWGVLGEPIREMQKPLSPEASRQRMRVPPGLRVELFASEPDIVNPIAMTWDERGRLWVIETVDYPNSFQPERKGNDRITICEDEDGDGKADRFTVFAVGLNIATSLCFGPEGLIVAQAPDIFLFKDTDGDDRADERSVILTGFGTGDTHAGPSNLRYGFDGWIWGTVGYSAFRGEVGGKSIRFGQGVFRSRPDGSALEYLTSTSNNTWGLGFSEAFDVFASTANNEHSVTVALPNRVFEGVSGWHDQGSQGIANHRNFHPITTGVRQVDWHDGYTAAAGHALYTARQLPPIFWNRVAFVCEPTGHLIHACYLQDRGTQFVGHDAYNLLASDDEWTSPIAAEVGPDGSVWFLDWYNYIVQHNPTPRGFETGRGNAYETPVRDRSHGRVYRIVPEKDGPAAMDLSEASPRELTEALGHTNLFWRLTAQRLLASSRHRETARQDDEVPARLAEAIRDPKVDALGLDVHALHALETLRLLELPIAPVLEDAFAHPSPAVRRAALRVAPRTADTWELLKAKRLFDDPDPFVRREALLLMAELPPSSEAGAIVFEVLGENKNTDDRWIPMAAVAAAARHDAGFLAAVLEDSSGGGASGEPKPQPNLLANPSFEESENEAPSGWTFNQYGGRAQGSLAEGGVTGKASIRITADRGADASFSQSVAVEPFSTYRLSARIRTEALSEGNSMGALLNVHELQGGGTRVATAPVTGTSDWTPVEVIFNSAGNRRLTINCLFGGWGYARGTAFYDDVELVWLGSTTGSGMTDEVMRIVTQHYAQRAPAESVGALLKGLRGASSARATALLSGLRSGWPEDQAPSIEGDDRAVVEELLARLDTNARGTLLALLGNWGVREQFAESLVATRRNLLSAATDRARPASDRIESATRLLQLEDSGEIVEALLDEITPAVTRDLFEPWLEMLTGSTRPELGGMLVERWERLPVRARGQAIDLLTKRKSWTEALLSGIEERAIAAAEISAEQRQLLTRFAAPEIRERAAQVLEGSGGVSSVDPKRVEELIARLETAKGDAKAGHTVYQENCLACHKVGEEGGTVGPELNGLAARPRAEILTAILNPNQSVEGNYRAWIVETKDGLFITGRLETETRTTIALLDSNAVRHELQRSEISSLNVSPLSIMPEGFDRLSEEQLRDLITFLMSSHGE